MLKVGILINHPGVSEIAFRAILNANSLDEVDDISIYYDAIQKPCINPHFGLFNAAQTYNHCGPAIATDIKTADRLLVCPGPTVKIFYVNDLEWYRQTFPINVLSNVYQSDALKLVTRSEQHAKIIENIWGTTPIGWTDTFDIKAILEMAGVKHGRTN